MPVILLLHGVWLAVAAFSHPVNEANFQRIEPGFSAWEVEAIMGRAANKSYSPGGIMGMGERNYEWHGHATEITVSFDMHRRAVSKTFLDLNRRAGFIVMELSSAPPYQSWTSARTVATPK